MQITVEYLQQVRQQVDNQRLAFLAQAQQAVGAIGAIDAMIARLELPETAKEADQ